MCKLKTVMFPMFRAFPRLASQTMGVFYFETFESLQLTNIVLNQPIGKNGEVSIVAMVKAEGKEWHGWTRGSILIVHHGESKANWAVGHVPAGG